MSEPTTSLANVPQPSAPSAVEQRENTALAKMSDFLSGPRIMARLKEMMGERAAARYVTNVLTAVMGSEDLQRCTPISVGISALRAATLQLSVDPVDREAYLVAYKDKATLLVGYQGLVNTAMATNHFSRLPYCVPVYKGEKCEFDRDAGLWVLSKDPEVEGIDKQTIIGWLADYEAVLDWKSPNRIRANKFMSIDEIHAHAKKYSASYSSEKPSNFWKKETRKMERKTVLRLLLLECPFMHKKLELDEADVDAEAELLEAEAGISEAELQERDAAATAEEEAPRRSREQAMAELGFRPDPAGPEQPELMK